MFFYRLTKHGDKKMEKRILVNEYGSRYGVELIFDSWDECIEYENREYGPDGFPNGHDGWDQLRIKILNPDQGPTESGFNPRPV